MIVYGTKAKLWYDLEREYLDSIYAYVALLCNAKHNDPTSNPLIVCQEFHKVSIGQGSEFYQDKWEQQKRGFKRLAEKNLAHDRATMEQVIVRIASATYQNAAPVILHIKVERERLKESPDRIKEGFPLNEEYIVDDISPDEISQVAEVCDC